MSRKVFLEALTLDFHENKIGTYSVDARSKFLIFMEPIMSEAQLKLDVDIIEPPVGGSEVDLIDSVLAACGGDPRLAIQELLADADFLRDQLYTASCLLSRGIGRGWTPKYERMP
ncbi:hypothetical protein ABIA16_003593 [Sinorhizobium fredii]